MLAYFLIFWGVGSVFFPLAWMYKGTGDPVVNKMTVVVGVCMIAYGVYLWEQKTDRGVIYERGSASSSLQH